MRESAPSRMVSARLRSARDEHLWGSHGIRRDERLRPCGVECLPEGGLLLVRATSRPTSRSGAGGEGRPGRLGRVREGSCHEQVGWVLEKAFDGGVTLTFRPALRSVRPDSVLRRVSSRHPSVKHLSDLRRLSLEDCDASRRSGLGWAIGSAAEGPASSIAMTGAEVTTTVSGGVTRIGRRHRQCRVRGDGAVRRCGRVNLRCAAGDWIGKSRRWRPGREHGAGRAALRADLVGVQA